MISSKASKVLFPLMESLILVGMLFGLAVLLVPAHWTSIWMDREFTGWVIPISSQLSDGVKLYAAGGHIPMPPLPFIIGDLLSPTFGSGWLLESSLNFLFQAFSLLVLFALLRKVAPRGIAFLSILGTIPIFFSLPKTIFYDALAQFFVACLAYFSVPLTNNHRESKKWWIQISGRSASFCGVCCALLFFTKQSTAIGAIAGILLLIILLPRQIKQKCQQIIVFFSVFLLCSLIICLLISPWISPSGFLLDVLINGSEPKGGVNRMLENLARYSFEIIRIFISPVSCLLISLVFLVLSLGKNKEVFSCFQPAATVLVPYLGAILGIACAFGVWLFGWSVLSSETYMSLIFMSALIWAFSIWVSTLRFGLKSSNLCLAGLFLITFTSAIFHSLSVPTFRWSYDNNPLIAVVIAICFCIMLQSCNRIAFLGLGHSVGITIFAISTLVIQWSLWATIGPQVNAALACKVAWPEVKHLTGARLRPEASGMRELVSTIRQVSTEQDKVMLLPSDPNVSEWFERPKQQVSSLIVFSDQYWDRYVDSDFDILKADLPKVIVIGPQKYWRNFSHQWNKGSGAERLIDRIVNELLPIRYKHHVSQKIKFQGQEEIMDVYVRQ